MDMNRQVKYTHVTARTNSALKGLSVCTLEEVCNGTLSWAYRRLSAGHGLITAYDQETFELLTRLINAVRRITSPVSLSPQDYANFIGAREKVLTELEAYRTYVDNGSNPVYLDDIFTPEERNAYIISVYGRKDLSAARSHLLRNRQHLKARMSRVVSEAEKGVLSTVLHDTVYQIRADYSNKKSDSVFIRGLLDGIVDVPSKTNSEARKIMEDDIQIIRDFMVWREGVKARKKSEILLFEEENNLTHLHETLKKIRIPEYQAEQNG